MSLLIFIMQVLCKFNNFILRICRNLGVLAVVLMVVAILIQVFFRYILNNALPWPDEAARFCMLWMTGLMAPTAFRRGGFVAIDFINQFIPSIINVILSMVLLLLSLLVLITSVQIGYAEVTGFGGRFATASLYIPVSIDLQNWYRIPRSWMMMSLLIGCVLLILVNLELIGRNIIFKLGKGNLLPKIHDDTSMEIT
ncbi:TRAP transporter small permease [Amylibacter sp.]|nr:TRAP transporter small permease [Amylibacter sp.]MDB4245729.1 TRAP transporter small permease [Amylibacter sp.]